MRKSKKINNPRKDSTKKRSSELKKKRNKKIKKSKKKMVGGELYIKEKAKSLNINERNNYWIKKDGLLEAIEIIDIQNGGGARASSGIYTCPWGVDSCQTTYYPKFLTIMDFIKARDDAIKYLLGLNIVELMNAIKETNQCILYKLNDKQKKDTIIKVLHEKSQLYYPAKIIETHVGKRYYDIEYIVRYLSYLQGRQLPSNVDESQLESHLTDADLSKLLKDDVRVREDQVRFSIGTFKLYNFKKMNRDENIESECDYNRMIRTGFLRSKTSLLSTDFLRELYNTKLTKYKSQNLETDLSSGHNPSSQGMVNGDVVRALKDTMNDETMELSREAPTLSKDELIRKLKVFDGFEASISELYKFPHYVSIQEVESTNRLSEEEKLDGFDIHLVYATKHYGNVYPLKLMDFNDGELARESFIYELIQGKRVTDLQICYYCENWSDINGKIRNIQSTDYKENIKKKYKGIIDRLIEYYNIINIYRSHLEAFELKFNESKYLERIEIQMGLDRESNIFIDEDVISVSPESVRNEDLILKWPFNSDDNDLSAEPSREEEVRTETTYKTMMRFGYKKNLNDETFVPCNADVETSFSELNNKKTNNYNELD